MISLLRIIKDDLRNQTKGGFIRIVLVLLYNRSFHLILNYRLGNYLHHRRNFLISLWILHLKKRQLKYFNCDISYNAIIGKNIKFPHPLGIVIGTDSIIKDNVKIWQNVTLGSNGEFDKKYPVINDNVKIYSNSQIIGAVTIGQNVIIGASTLVLKSIPENKTAVGIPSKIIN